MIVMKGLEVSWIPYRQVFRRRQPESISRPGMGDPPKDFDETLLKIESERRTLQSKS